MNVLVFLMVIGAACAFVGPRTMRKSSILMSQLESTDSLNLAALPTIEEWMGVVNPDLRKTTIAMFRAVKEISYKVSDN